MLAVNGSMWTSLKMVLMLLKHSPLPTFKKLTALTVIDLHSSTIHCPLNVNGLLWKASVIRSLML
jgi:hypothetical protein